MNKRHYNVKKKASENGLADEVTEVLSVFHFLNPFCMNIQKEKKRKIEN